MRREWPVLPEAAVHLSIRQWLNLVDFTSERTPDRGDFAAIPAAGAEGQLPMEADVRDLAHTTPLNDYLGRSLLGWSSRLLKKSIFGR
jgi:hypothetical protein